MSEILIALKKGLPVSTKNGRPAHLVSYDPKLPAPIMAAVKKKKGTYVLSHCSDPYELVTYFIDGKYGSPAPYENMDLKID